MDTDRKTLSAEPQASRLSPQEMKVIRMRFGLADGREYTPKEIATALGVTLKQALEIEARALRLLRHPSRSHRMRAFLENGVRGA